MSGNDENYQLDAESLAPIVSAGNDADYDAMQNEEENSPEYLQAAQEIIACGKGWTRFVAIMLIVLGSLYALTIVGIVFAWLPIWLGVVLLNAVNKGNNGQGAIETALGEYMRGINSFFKISGISTLVFTIVYGSLMLLYIIIIGAVVLAAILGAR